MEYDSATAWPGMESFASPVPLDSEPQQTNAAPLDSVADTSSFYSPKGTWFDEAIDFRDPEGEAVTKEVLALIRAFEERKRKRREIDEGKHYIIVRKILANGLRCHFHRRPHLVSYLRKADGYTGGSTWLRGRALARTVDLMAAAGLLDNRLGAWGEVSSTYHIKPKLYGVAQACGITSHSLTLRLAPERLVRLREANSKTPCLAFEPSDETRRWTDQLEAYNAFIRQQEIGLALTPHEETAWVRHWNEKRNGRDQNLPALCRPERFKTDLYRSFNNGSFWEGGRLYGAWWVNTPEHLRERITINGKPTVELDYSGCAIRMLYHERGIDYRDDPYWLEPLVAYEAEAGLGTGYYREGVKRLMQAGINSDPNGKWEMARIDGFTFKPAFDRPQIRRMIEEKHALIADTFGTGAGLRLQRRDSDLALAIITELKGHGIVALPIHDSFLATEERKDDLFRIMNQIYKDTFDFYPLIK